MTAAPRHSDGPTWILRRTDERTHGRPSASWACRHDPRDRCHLQLDLRGRATRQCRLPQMRYRLSSAISSRVLLERRAPPLRTVALQARFHPVACRTN
jgi:hypothetical protein